MLRVVIFGHPNNDVYHIRHAATTFGAAIKLFIDLGGHNQLPGICAQQVKDDVLDLLGRDHVALTNEHEATVSRQELGWPHKAC
tara:strand:- start:3413 stop:3664 length:252 start_codon:yes stop_codon:yes gene_type:complete